MELFRKAFAEFLGTCAIALAGCGAAMTFGYETAGSVFVVAIAFGLAFLAMHAAFAPVSGGYFHPAVCFARLICGAMRVKEFFIYLAAQTAGGFFGVFLLRSIDRLGGIAVRDRTGNFSAGMLPQDNSYAAAILTELLVSAFFALVVLFVLNAYKKRRLTVGTVLGLSFAAVCLGGYPLTGCTCDPAISVGSVCFALIDKKYDAVTFGWIYLIVPFAGAALAALIYLFVTNSFSRAQSGKSGEKSSEGPSDPDVLS